MERIGLRAYYLENANLVGEQLRYVLGVEDFLRTNRDYWGIENGAHQRLDCSAMEDRLRVRDQNAATVLGLFHRMSLTLVHGLGQDATRPARSHLSDLPNRA